MSGFEETTSTSFAGRTGVLHTDHGDIQTPAFFPVLNLIGGTTPASGGIWSRTRNFLFEDEQLQGAMFQSMSFLDFGLSPSNLQAWREQSLHDHFQDRSLDETVWDRVPDDFTSPLFVDSGGFKLLNARKFKTDTDEDNEWEIETTPESILDLQLDYGADIIATLDFPIPPDLNEDEALTRMEDSIDSAIKCLELLRERADSPLVYAAIHGHDYGMINWYVTELKERAGDLFTELDGLAVGSLVPLRSNPATLVDIVYGALDPLSPAERESLGLHVFGVGGHFTSLLTLLGVDSFDSTTYVQLARNRKVLDPDSWAQVDAETLDESWDCTCPSCMDLDLEANQAVMFSEDTPDKYASYYKSDFYARYAYHNFRVYQAAVEDSRRALQEGTLLEHVLSFVENDSDIRKGLQRAVRHDSALFEEIKAKSPESFDLDISPEAKQTDLSDFEDPLAGLGGELSLEYEPADLNATADRIPPADGKVLLILACSQTKPYHQSRSHRVVEDTLGEYWNDISKVTVSGLFGPVPEKIETEPPADRYDYVLSKVDSAQQSTVTSRLVAYLDRYGGDYDAVIGYVTNTPYRSIIQEALERAELSQWHLCPESVPRQRLTEHFRRTNLEELRDTVETKLTVRDETLLSSE